jgi:hypothetical protein
LHYVPINQQQLIPAGKTTSVAMKRLKTVTLLVTFIVAMLHGIAQESKPPLNSTDYHKPKFYADLPEKATLRVSDLESLLYLPVGAKVNTMVTSRFPLVGTVISTSGPTDPNVKSVVIRSANRRGTMFTFTRITEEDGSYSYNGRLLNKAAGDAMEIVKEGKAYVIRKKPSHEIIAE